MNDQVLSRDELIALNALIRKVLAQDWPASWDLRTVVRQGYDPTFVGVLEDAELATLDRFSEIVGG